MFELLTLKLFFWLIAYLNLSILTFRALNFCILPVFTFNFCILTVSAFEFLSYDYLSFYFLSFDFFSFDFCPRIFVWPFRHCAQKDLPSKWIASVECNIAFFKPLLNLGCIIRFFCSRNAFWEIDNAVFHLSNFHWNHGKDVMYRFPQAWGVI